MDKILIINRKLHLYASFAIALFLLMYFLSGAIIITGKIFPRKNLISISDKIALKNNQTEKDAVTDILKHYDIRGVESISSGENGGINYLFYRPGYRAEIKFVEGKDSINVNINKGTIWSALNDFHRLRGYASRTHIAWAVFYDLSCIALLLFSVTGVYLWWKLERKKLPGIIFLSTSTALTIFSIWYLYEVC